MEKTAIRNNLNSEKKQVLGDTTQRLKAWASASQTIAVFSKSPPSYVVSTRRLLFCLRRTFDRAIEQLYRALLRGYPSLQYVDRSVDVSVV